MKLTFFTNFKNMPNRAHDKQAAKHNLVGSQYTVGEFLNATDHPDVASYLGLRFANLEGGVRKKVRLAMEKLDLGEFPQTKGKIEKIIAELKK